MQRTVGGLVGSALGSDSAEQLGDRVLLACAGDERRRSDFVRAVNTMRQAVTQRCMPGDVVAIVGDTSIEFIEAVVGVMAAGAVALPLSPQYPLAERQRACALADPALVITMGDLDAVDQASSASLGRVHLAWADHATDVVSDALIGDEQPPQLPELEPNASALLLFTSGTAGMPRLAELTHANIEASISSTIEHSPELAAAAEVVLGVMPLTHVLGLVTVVGVSLALGSTLVLVPRPTVDAVVAEIGARQVSLLVAPPIFWHRLAEAGIGAEALASVQLGLAGAAPLSGSLAQHVSSSLGIELRQGYGLTEASPALTSSVGLGAPATSVGRPLPGVELRLVDEFGDEALIGDVGEVLARGANVFSGYRNDPEATRQVLDDDGWLHTGDLAVVDDRGYLYIVGRSKDQIICAGFNVHPAEVEERLMRHDRVAAAAVVGAPDREYGEVVVAWVVPEPPLNEAKARAALAVELGDHCRQVLAGYKVPSQFEFVDELPRGLGGKLRRRALRAT